MRRPSSEGFGSHTYTRRIPDHTGRRNGTSAPRTRSGGRRPGPPWPITTSWWPGCTATRRPFDAPSTPRPASRKDAGLDGRC